MANPPIDTDILVHISASCKAVDDMRYRALAESYVDVEPSTKHAINGSFHLYGPAQISINTDGPMMQPSSFDQPDSHSLLSDPPFERFGTRPLRPEQEQAEPETPASRKRRRDDADDEDERDDAPSPSKSKEERRAEKRGFSGSFSTASFKDVADNLNSPELRVRQQSAQYHEREQEEEESFEVPDSDPWNHAAIPELSSPTRLLENYLHQYSSSPELNDGFAKENALFFILELWTQENSTTRPQAAANTASSSVIPETIMRSSSSVGEETILKSSETVIPESSYGNRAADYEIEPSTSKGEHSGAGEAQHSQQTPIQDKKSAAPDFTKYDAVVTLDFFPQHGYTFESLEVFAPGPPVTTADLFFDPQSLITPRLQKLAADLDISKRFRP
ncbi:Uu.00g098650.m01.CDS01 [Anthostomella pinea]|uniref:Uu.00g098650.m01.CDS01 n=1 Tax=Anthostomella pinea TaxID=933095 RepID=A0AAI8YF22_9PEZI|nr:Uu.00g098650.m01.CDS01 [Anthostomella pinea]